MSFALTEAQMLARTKTVTRRLRWRQARRGMLLQPIRKGQGLKAGESVVRLGYPIRVTDVRQERLDAITPEEVVREGFPDWTPAQFIEMFTGANVCPPHQLVTRIGFEYMVPLPSYRRCIEFPLGDLSIEPEGVVWVRAEALA
jgi:hypothetical protein